MINDNLETVIVIDDLCLHNLMIRFNLFGGELT